MTNNNMSFFFGLPRKTSPILSCLITLLLISIDVITGSGLRLTLFYVLLVAFSGWFNSLQWALFFSVLIPLVRVVLAFTINPAWNEPYLILNTIDRIIILGIIAFLTAQLAEYVRLLQSKVKVLEGILSICANCKKIRDEHDLWQPIERYISEHSTAQFTHGICPDCAKVLYPGFVK